MILFSVIALAFFPAFTHAQVVITEVMYDLSEGSDSGREWIEVLNGGQTTIDLTTWKLFENGINHKVSGPKTFTPGSYAIIADNPAKFATDWPSHSGIVFDSAFSLGNEGDTVALRMGASDVDAATFSAADGGDGTGDSLQRNAAGAAFEAGIPTPGSGIPAAGLQKSPPKQSKSAAKKQAAAPVEIEIVGSREDRESAKPVQAVSVAAAAAGAHDWYWWFAPLCITGISFAGVAWSRHLKKKDEWDIIEEVEETS